MKVLILCTGNTCRSQMAEGYLQSLDPSLQVTSAGIRPGNAVNPYAVLVMKEIGIDISGNHPKSVDQFLDHSFDFAITVCDNARDNCPYFTGDVRSRLHINIDDPSKAGGSDESILSEYRKVRDQVTGSFKSFYEQRIKNSA